MKYKKYIFTLIAISFIASLFAQTNEDLPKTTFVSGIGNYGVETIDSLEGTGLIKLNGTTISNALKLSGSLIANNVEIGSLDVMGEANLTSATITNPSTIAGGIQATRTKFKKDLFLHSQRAIFKESELEGITIYKDAALKNKQIIELKQKTIVNGPIHFESGKGEVILHSGCLILGPVTGGKIVKKQ